jgi:hypothetical protein
MRCQCVYEFPVLALSVVNRAPYCQPRDCNALRQTFPFRYNARCDFLVTGFASGVNSQLCLCYNGHSCS